MPHTFPFLMRGPINPIPPPPPPPPPPPAVGLGWTRLANTRMRTVCVPNGFGGPADFFGNPVLFSDLFPGIFAWSSGCFDTLRNRMILLGGGHANYPGNELYAVSLANFTTTRLTDPTIPTNWNNETPVRILSDGKPNNRHTYGGVCYIEHADRLCMIGGTPTGNPGGFYGDTWTCDMATLQWFDMNPSGYNLPSGATAIACAYDTNTGFVWVHDGDYLFVYDFLSNSYTRLTAFDFDTGHGTLVVDPVRQKLLLTYSYVYWEVDISPGSSYVFSDLIVPTGGGPVGAVPGYAYEPDLDRMIAWAGGSPWSLDLDARTWTELTFTSGDTPPATVDQLNTGIFNRFAYSPTSKCLVLVRDVDDDAFTLKLTSSAITTLRLVSSNTGAQPFMAGLAFKKGDVPGIPGASIPDYQMDVKRRWNDGSVKHAIISGQVALTANVPLSVTINGGGAPSGGSSLTAADIAAAAPSASFQAGTIGTVNLSSLLASPIRTWITGPEMVECHYRSQIGTDASLAVEFQVRLWKSGKIWIRVIAENGYLNASTSDKTYFPMVIIGGVTAYDNGGVSLLHCAQTRWMAEGWIGGNPDVFASHDPTYLVDSKLVPNYWKRNPSQAALNALTQIYTPMGRGNLTLTMHDTGFQASIGLLPQWDALYAVSADRRAFNSMMANSGHLNSYPIVWRDSSTGRVAKPSDQPNFVIGGSGGDSLSTAAGFEWEANHAPSEGYLSYLLTGDYWHYETMLMQCSLIYYILPSNRGSGLTKLINFQTRGWAWSMRTFSHLCGIFPEGDVVAEDFQNVLAYNAYALKANADSLIGVQETGYVYSYDLFTNAYHNPGVLAPWQQHFFIQTMGMGSDLEPLPDMTNWDAARDWMYKGVIGILGATSGYHFPYASQYAIKAAAAATASPSTWYPDWATIWTNSNNMVAGTVSTGSFASTTTQFESADVNDDPYNPDAFALVDWSAFFVKFTSGSLNGQVFLISAYSKVGSNGHFTTYSPMPFPPADGVTFILGALFDNGATNTLQGFGSGAPTVAVTGYWGNLMPAIAYAVDHGASGAAASWARVSGASNFSDIENSSDVGVAGFDDMPQFGIVPRGFA